MDIPKVLLSLTPTSLVLSLKFQQGTGAASSSERSNITTPTHSELIYVVIRVTRTCRCCPQCSTRRRFACLFFCFNTTDHGRLRSHIWCLLLLKMSASAQNLLLITIRTWAFRQKGRVRGREGSRILACAMPNYAEGFDRNFRFSSASRHRETHSYQWYAKRTHLTVDTGNTDLYNSDLTYPSLALFLAGYRLYLPEHGHRELVPKHLGFRQWHPTDSVGQDSCKIMA